ncbi:ClpP/crotonase-like domain-containing protein [Mycena alexandri]|uniref:ClpP/crotonase-like domain-containing protein n=1 Tax=Mycena alexandri TaxID=1745969 RepID=A0AAD6S8K6_9AGAR|nr:ClpP/crotonase-like domain-containing protein [Mycena alexandri]
MALAQNLSSKWISVSEPHPHVLHVELARQARKPVNAFSSELWAEYGALLDKITHEGRDVRALVLSSALPKLFTAGIDIADLSKTETDFPDGARKSLSTYHHLKEFQHAIGAPERCSFPIIAAVHGLVVGLGIDIISACDIRYAAEGTQFTIKEVDVGLAADIGTLAYLPKAVGNQSLLREVAYTSRLFSAAEAERMGLLSTVVPGGREEVIAAALKLASVIASKSPIAVSSTKRILLHSRDHSASDNLEYTAAWNSAALQTNDIPETLRATKSRSAPAFVPLRKAAAKL